MPDATASLQEKRGQSPGISPSQKQPQ